MLSVYHKISIISLGLIFDQKTVLLGLFSGELIFGGAYGWRELFVSKWDGLDNKTSYSVTLTAHGLIFGRAYYRKDICV